jgi:hypothetical protein
VVCFAVQHDAFLRAAQYAQKLGVFIAVRLELKTASDNFAILRIAPSVAKEKKE